MKEVTKNFTPKKFTVFPGIKKVGLICQNFIREYPYKPPKTPEKVNFQTITWGGSRYLKVVNPFVWCQSEYTGVSRGLFYAWGTDTKFTM